VYTPSQADESISRVLEAEKEPDKIQGVSTGKETHRVLRLIRSSCSYCFSRVDVFTIDYYNIN
jgi:hypothetical protein